MLKSLVAAGFLLLSGTAHAALTLDQSYVPSFYRFPAGLLDQTRQAMVVTAGSTGFMGRVDIAVSERPQLTFSAFNIYSVNNGLPTDTIIGTGTFDSFSDGFARFNTSLLTNAGQQFAFEPVGNTSWGASGNGYAGGNGAYKPNNGNPDTPWADRGGSDTVFRTYVGAVSVAAVPEPATWAMMIVGVGAVGGAIRRRGGGYRRLATG